MQFGDGVSATDLALDEETRILEILDSVPDPEIPAISITDLGIVRGVRRDPPAVLITPTYTGCPATLAIEMSVRAALLEAGFGNIKVETVLSPAWSSDWITDRGRKRLHEYGIAPPPKGADSPMLNRDEAVQCPQCGSTETAEVSRFGSTPCKALWRCLDCLEPFDRFKCH
ncbi:MAG: paaJ [Sphingomonadales bacterium]|nr:paaJ [Sphingomonadales bacterium]